MKVYFLHSGNPITATTFDEQVHIRMQSIYDGAVRIFYKKELINAYAQMNSLKTAGVETSEGILDHRSSFSHLMQSGKRLKKEVEHNSCDLVHVTWGTFSALLAVLFSPVPVVVSFCGSDILGGYTTTGKRAIKSTISVLLSQLAAFKASRVIAKSGRIKNAVWRINRGKTQVIPNGVNLSKFYPVNKNIARNNLEWNTEIPIVLFFHVNGQSVKNRPLAEETFHLVKQQVPDAELVIVDNVPHTELINYYNAADVMLLTSFHEGSNNSVKEALACSLPIVSVNCGDITDRLKDITPSAVVKAYDANLLAEETIKILNNRIRSNGEHMIKEISEPYIAAKIMEVYREALGR
jgi:teichuronic acid biosynthesis glycosyltransferase TuaC